MKFSRKYRSDQVENMDDNQFQGKEMQDLLADLDFINKWLGGNNIAIKGVHTLLKNQSTSKEITVLDIGCGDGSTLRSVADHARQNNIAITGIGIDFNDYILKEAARKSKSYSNIGYLNIDVFKEANQIPPFDIAICSLFLHHFENQEIETLLRQIIQKTAIGIVVNDLHRNWVAYNAFKLISFLFLKTETATHDGLISIAKGFRKSELIQFSQKIPFQKSSISWQWAFRYLWILKKEAVSI